MVAISLTAMSSTSLVTVRVPASPAGIAAAADALSRLQAGHGVGRETGWPVHVALDEILSNIVRHGGGQTHCLGRLPADRRAAYFCLAMIRSLTLS